MARLTRLIGRGRALELLPDDEDPAPGLTAFFTSTARPATQARLPMLAAHGSDATASWSADWASWSPRLSSRTHASWTCSPA
jgi:hypothetical protein